MKSVSENTEKTQHDDFLEEFAASQESENNSDCGECFSDDGAVIFENITRNDILHNEYLYKQVFIFPDVIEMTNYIAELRQVAKKFRLTRDFDSKMNAYKARALMLLKEAEKEQRKQDFLKISESFPEWWDGQTIDEDVFCKCFLKNREMKCINRLLYDVDGLVDESAVESEIYNLIRNFCKKDIASRVKRILETLKTCCYSKPIEVDEELIHLQNGTLRTNGDFTSEKYFCTCRLNVTAPQQYKEPENWIKFVSELLEPEDVLTLQEYMGYCLIPSTKAQKMLMIIGNGGEGKSRIGVIMQAIFGLGGLSSGQVIDFDNTSKSKFARAKLISRLVFLDDDLDLTGFAKTSFLKQLVTAEIPLEVEDKHKSSSQMWLYSRVLAFGNGAITSLYDKSDGFYRRQIILTAKPKPKDRKDDKFLSDKLLNEKDMIFLWCFKGLKRLIENNFEFTESEKTKRNLEESRREGCNIIEFLESGYDFCFDKNSECHTSDLYMIYERWCNLNALDRLARKTFTRFLNNNADKYGIKSSDNIVIDQKRAKGFKGIRCKHYTEYVR